MKIFDCTIYNGEDHLLELRLNELQNVDFFVIVESNISFSGIKKEYRFNVDKFPSFRKKIRYVQIGNEKANYNNQSYYTFFKHEKWQREFAMRDAILTALYDCNDDDLIVLSDIDELPDLNKITTEHDIFIFDQTCCQFKFNLKNPGLTPYFGSKAIKFKNLGVPSEFRIFDQKHLSIKKYDHLTKKIIKGGFHFSYCLTVSKILEKVNFYSHCERAKDITVERISQCIEQQKDIWDGNFNYANNISKLEKLPIELLPKYIQNNKQKFKDFLLEI